MNNLVGLSTGSIYSWDPKIDKQIEIISRLNVRAIEVLFSHETHLTEGLNIKSISILNKMKYVSIHAPFYKSDKKEIFYDSNQKTNEVIKRLEKIYFEVNAKAIVFHPNLVKRLDLFDNTKMNVCFENMPKKSRVKLKELEGLVKNGYQLIFDSAHSLTYGRKYMNNFIKAFSGVIQHIHFSDRRFSEFFGKIKDHQQIMGCKNLDKFKELVSLQCPILLELNIQDKKYEIENLKQEIDFVKQMFTKD
ncbi:MAG TPA: hypothetical protein PLX15_01230 [Candidatus Woesearchaeota archaeon]|nr:hypothetical protein [Candidatus Woesearchaeota archaeon]